MPAWGCSFVLHCAASCLSVLTLPLLARAQLEDKYAKKAIQLFSESAGMLESNLEFTSPKKDEPETVSRT